MFSPLAMCTIVSLFYVFYVRSLHLNKYYLLTYLHIFEIEQLLIYIVYIQCKS